MKSALRAVIDTNVFISALLGSPVCNEITESLKQKKFLYTTSLDLLHELAETIHKPKFISLDDVETDKFLKLLRKRAKIIFPDEPVNVCRDPKDNMVLECAQAGKPDYIVTGDKDLLVLKKFNNSRILTPQEFIKKLR